jgi:hypothetical protein
MSSGWAGEVVVEGLEYIGCTRWPFESGEWLIRREEAPAPIRTAFPHAAG